jgi:hypothetical protein
MINVSLGIQQDCALSVSKATNWEMEAVTFPLSTMPSLLTLDAPNGTGTTKFASSAQMDGLLMPTKFATLSVINAKNGILLVYVQPASRVTT